VSITNGWYAARYQPGVIDLILDGLRPAVVHDEIIAGLKASERNGALEISSKLLEVGDRVRILAGPLQGQVGLLCSLRPHERCLVLMSWLGRVEVARAAVEVV
jgi:transcription antitermination factor NusG